MSILKISVIVLIVVLAFFGVIKTYRKEYAKDQESGYPDLHRKETIDLVLKIKPFIIVALVVILVIIGLFSSIYITDEQEIGFVSMFGQNTMIDKAGIHFKIPFISQKHVFDATTKGMAIGYTENSDETVTEDSLMITSDFNFINIDFYLEYRITDPIAYFYSTNDPEGILRNVVQSAIRNTVGQYSVDEVMTTGKSQIEIDVYDDIVNELEKHQTGLTVMNITIQDSEPPTTDVAKAFKDVEDAKQNADTAVNGANSYTNTELPAAEAQAAKILQDADATKTERENAAKEEVATFEALFSEYSQNPDVVKTRMYYEALSEILPKMEIIIGEDSKIVYVTGDEESAKAAAVANEE